MTPQLTPGSKDDDQLRKIASATDQAIRDWQAKRRSACQSTHLPDDDYCADHYLEWSEEDPV